MPILATLAWDVVGEYLCDCFGFERSCGPRLEVVRGRYSGDVAAYFDEVDKRDLAVSVVTELGVQLRREHAIVNARHRTPAHRRKRTCRGRPGRRPSTIDPACRRLGVYSRALV
ncbi:hypothetical protein [Micromonospora sp. KC213]|uniref:hypothetical protein n=1 Tax=Micromonospora sp. KC213 TaxID=2530378 RepID=UPI001042F49C|nr:hypothetical protein [Micromonospora sp. KC213]TDC43938.1 hypothetical protein E1166_01540 [Micromonospora sp. KC213]